MSREVHLKVSVKDTDQDYGCGFEYDGRTAYFDGPIFRQELVLAERLTKVVADWRREFAARASADLQRRADKATEGNEC